METLIYLNSILPKIKNSELIMSSLFYIINLYFQTKSDVLYCGRLPGCPDHRPLVLGASGTYSVLLGIYPGGILAGNQGI